jgi:hypothetical protein
MKPNNNLIFSIKYNTSVYLVYSVFTSSYLYFSYILTEHMLNKPIKQK